MTMQPLPLNPKKQISWIASQEAENTFLEGAPIEEMVDILANVHRKVDILITASSAADQIDSDLLSRLAEHPRVGTIIFFGYTATQRTLIRSYAVPLKLRVRFCNSEDELRVLQNKRRSYQNTIGLH